MSCYLIKVENGHKVARPITSEEEYKQLRGSKEQKANLRLARAGNDAAKRRLIQFNYSGHYPQGVVKGMKLPVRLSALIWMNQRLSPRLPNCC